MKHPQTLPCLYNLVTINLLQSKPNTLKAALVLTQVLFMLSKIKNTTLFIILDCGFGFLLDIARK